ncbi:MAG: biopolymer transporter ExbD [Sphingobacteriaceae bacterium]|nr:biopolymer transporter ExbD [Sphingobacteriaceae bacterium]
MAEIAEDGGGGGKKGGKRRAKKQSTRIDMTPMVDLAFLLLTFFVLTSTFSKPKSMELTFPVPPNPNDPPPPAIKNGITVLLTKDDKIFYYEGEFRAVDNETGAKTTLSELDFSQGSLHKYLADKNKWATDEIAKLDEKFKAKQMADTTYKRMVREIKANKQAPTILIKTDDKATYKNVIDVIDEININLIGKYVVVDILKSEMDLMTEKTGG